MGKLDGELKGIKEFSYHWMETKPKGGLWFSLDDSWFELNYEENPARLIGSNIYTCTFNGKLFHQNKLAEDRTYILEGQKRRYLDFKRMKDEGYDGFLCDDPSKDFLYMWEIPSVLVWSNTQKVKIIKEKKIPLITSFIEKEIWRKIYIHLEELNSFFSSNKYSSFVDRPRINIEDYIPNYNIDFENTILKFNYGSNSNHLIAELYPDFETKRLELENNLDKEIESKTEMSLEDLSNLKYFTTIEERNDLENNIIKEFNIWEEKKENTLKELLLISLWEISHEKTQDGIKLIIQNKALLCDNNGCDKIVDKSFEIDGINTDNYHEKIDELYNSWTIN